MMGPNRKAGVMPKETVYDESGMYDVVVGWERDKHVQVGVQAHNQQNLVVVDGEAQPAKFESLWGTFDRAGINRLIRSLRGARDQAYGRDE